VRDGDVGDHLTTRLAHTFADFEYVDDPDFGGNDLPGAPRHHLTGQLRDEHPLGLSIAPSIEWGPSAYFVSSESTVTTDSWATLGLRTEWRIARAGVTAFVEGRNLLDDRYSASCR
jgi:iron complex outermembrane receptor protein